MTNLEDKETPNIILPKRNKKYSKRIVITITVIGTLVMLIIGIAGTSTPQKRSVAAREKETLQMASAQKALDIDKMISEASLPDNSVLTYKQDMSAEKIEKKDEHAQIPLANIEKDTDTKAENKTNTEADRIKAEAEKERLNQERAARQQWLDLQREAYLSSPASQGGSWPGQTKNATAPEKEQKSPRRDNPYLEVYEKYLEHENQKAGDASSQSQSDKERFFTQRNSGKGILTSAVQAPISPYIIPSGTMIPCNLITGVNSDLPGYVVAQTSENVCDWKNPNVILIPQGTRVFGIYDSKIAFAQRRVQVSWSRLIYPDGTTLDLQGMPGADKRGYSGLSDKYYPRYGRLLTAAIMTAAFSSVGLLFDDDSGQTVVSTGSSTVVIPDDNNDARNEFAREVADSIGNAGEQLFNKYLNTQPTVLIRPAKRFNIVVNADIPFFSSYGRVR